VSRHAYIGNCQRVGGTECLEILGQNSEKKEATGSPETMVTGYEIVTFGFHPTYRTRNSNLS
jgi:hypothetical protein